MKNIIIVSGGRYSGRTFLRLLHEYHRQGGENLILGFSAQDAAQAMKSFADSIRHTTDAFDNLSELIKDWKDKEKIIEKPRGVIPEKYKNNIQLRKSVKK